MSGDYVSRPLAIGLICLLVGVGCAESIHIRTYPEGATVQVDGHGAGKTPMLVRVPRSAWDGQAIPYRVEKEGYDAATGALDVCVTPGRLVAGFFSMGISFIFKRPSTFCHEEVVVRLQPHPIL